MKKSLFAPLILFTFLLSMSFMVSVDNNNEVSIENYQTEEYTAQQPIDYTSGTKYVDGISQSWNIDDIRSADEFYDGTTYDNSITTRDRYQVHEVTSTGDPDKFYIEGSTISETVQFADQVFVYHNFIYTHEDPHIYLSYTSNQHLTEVEKQSVVSIDINYVLKVQEPGIFEGGLLESQNLDLDFQTSQGTWFYHRATPEIFNNVLIYGSVTIPAQSNVIDDINNGGYISLVDYNFDIDGVWLAPRVYLVIDQLTFTYNVKSNFQLDLQYDLSVPDYELSYITDLIVKFKFDSGTDCSVYIRDIDDAKYPLGTYKDTHTVVPISVPEPENFILGLGMSSDPYITLHFEVDEEYVPDPSARQIKVDYIGFDYSEDQNPSIDDITLRIDSYDVAPVNDVYYLSGVPTIFVNATDGSGIRDPDGVTLNDTMHNVHVLTPSENPNEFILQPVVGDVWDDYFQTLGEGTYSWNITAYDIHSNSEVVSIEIVKDTIKPQISFENLPEYSGATPPTITIDIEEENLDYGEITMFADGDDFTWDLVRNGSLYTLDPATITEYQDAWNNASESSVGFLVEAIDLAGNVNSTFSTVIKDVSDPEITVLYPISNEEIKFTPDISVSVEDVSVNISSVIMFAESQSDNGTFSLEYLELSVDIFEINSELGDYGLWNDFFMNSNMGQINLTFYAEDMLGHNGTQQITILKIDPTPPQITLLSQDTLWHADPVYVNASVSDYNIDSVWYTVSGYATKFPINTTIPQHVWDSLDDGPNSIHVIANDTAGNINNIGYSVKIDRHAPVITSINPENLSAWNQPPEILINVSDIEGDSDLTLYYLHDGDQYTLFNNQPIQLNQIVWNSYVSGEYITLTIVANDSLDFSTQQTINILVDVLPPVISMWTLNGTRFNESIPTIDYSTNEPVDLTVKYEGEIIDFNSWWAAAEYGQYLFDLEFEDAGGNVIERGLRLYKDDTINPNIAVNYPDSGDVVGEQPPLISISLYDLTLDGATYTIIGQTFNIFFDPGQTDVDLTFTPDANVWDDAYNLTVTITIEATDAYGNMQSISILLIRSDYTVAHAKDGLGLGLFLNMNIPAIIICAAGIIVGGSVTLIIAKKRRVL